MASAPVAGGRRSAWPDLTSDYTPLTSTNTTRREWRNGRRAGLRIRCPKGRGGSTPPSRTGVCPPGQLVASVGYPRIGFGRPGEDDREGGAMTCVRRSMTLVGTLAILVLLAPVAALATPGDLDPSFG